MGILDPFAFLVPISGSTILLDYHEIQNCRNKHLLLVPVKRSRILKLNSYNVTGV